MVGFASIGHVAIRTKDIARSLDFYVGRLGCKEILRLNYADGSLFLIYLRVSDTQFLELFPNGVGERGPDREAVALNHFCLIVESIERAVAELVEAGIPLARELRTGPDGNRQCWIDDPDGNRVEIMELRQDCVQFSAVRGLQAGSKPVVLQTEVPPPAPR